MYKKYKNIDIRLMLNIFLVICILLSVCILSIGYAALSAKDLNIQVSLSTKPYVGMFISKVQYSNSSGANITDSKILDYTGTMLHSNIYLSQTDINSSITYEVTIYNNSDSLKQFTGVTYSEEFYSNSNIKYELEGINVKDTIAMRESKTFLITFSYNNISSITDNQLESYLNFNFDYYFEEEVEVDIDISTDGDFVFAGVSPENPVDLANIANIMFTIKNTANSPIKDIEVDVTYNTRTGSKQSAVIYLCDENNVVLSSKSIQFLGKQNNAIATAVFNDLNIQNGTKFIVRFDKETITNGHVDTVGILLKPIF